MTYYGPHVEREILSALIDGELSPEERRFVHEHLQECSACREVADEFTQVHGMVVDLPRLVAPAAFVSEALRPRTPSRTRAVATTALSGRRRWVAAGIAVAAAAISLAGLFTPRAATETPVDAYVARHVAVHSGADSGGSVLFAVRNR